MYESTSMSPQLVSQFAELQCVGDFLPDHIVTNVMILNKVYLRRRETLNIQDPCPITMLYA